MGSSSWSNDSYAHLRKSMVSKNTDDIFKNNKSHAAAKEMLPAGITFRECRDSDAHPNSFGVSVFLDVTGSMGQIPENMIRNKLGVLMETLIAHGINDAAVLFGAIGDHHSDNYPLQVGQFESGTNELNKCLTSIYIEQGGGGGGKESYLLAWLIGARHISMDCFEKRNSKGFVFTIGDESSHNSLSGDKLKDLMGYKQSETITDKQLLEELKRTHHVFHIHVNEGSYRDDDTVLSYWRNALGEGLIILNDQDMIAEVIATTVAMIHGIDMDKFISSFDSKTAIGVKNALVDVHGSLAKYGSGATTGALKL